MKENRMKGTTFELEHMHADQSRFEEAAYLLRALGNEIRLRVIMQLALQEEMSVSELMCKTGCEQSLLSHHLTDMRAKGILSCRRSGKNSFYSIKDRRIVNVLKCVMKCGSDLTLQEGSETLN
mgnify:CR=1 FL=1